MKNIVKIIILMLMISILLTIFLDWYKENEILEDNIVMEASIKQEESIEYIEKENVWEEQQEGYKVIARLDIPKINLKTNVLGECNDKSLLVSVGKFWGGEPNQVGNFCIAGHNYYKRKNMFYNLRELKNGDIVYLTDTKNNCLEYQVYSVSRVQPQDVECLSQDTNGNKEITLITCTSDSKKRIIVKAKEI